MAETSQDDLSGQEGLSEQEGVRRAKLEGLIAAGVDSYPV
jgi:hypothetical protein